VDHVHEFKQYCHALVPQQRQVSPEAQLQVAPALSPQPPHWQLPWQVCTPQQACSVPRDEHMHSAVAPGLHGPSPEHPLQEPHWQLPLQERLLWPQLPQPS